MKDANIIPDIRQDIIDWIENHRGIRVLIAHDMMFNGRMLYNVKIILTTEILIESTEFKLQEPRYFVSFKYGDFNFQFEFVKD